MPRPDLAELSIERVTPYQPLYRVHVKPAFEKLMLDAISETAKAINDRFHLKPASEELMLDATKDSKDLERVRKFVFWSKPETNKT